MSYDEFDPQIERLFAQAPVMPDAALFTAQVEARLNTHGRMRNVALAIAGLLGGGVAAREMANLNFNVSSAGGEAVRETVRDVPQALGGGALDAALSQFGLSGASLGMLDSVQLFWLGAASVVMLAVAAAVRLSQEV